MLVPTVPDATRGVQHENRPHLTNLDQFCFDPYRRYEDEPPIFESLISRRDVVVWLGREKHRKSNTLLQLAICAATGRDFLTFRFAAEKPIRVTYVDYESKATKFKHRYEAICNGLNLSPEERALLNENLNVILMSEASRKGAAMPNFPAGEIRPETPKESRKSLWDSFAWDFQADLWIIDPMRMFHGEDENSSLIEGLFRGIRAWARESAVIFAHHLSKTDSLEKALSSAKGYKPFNGDFRAWSDHARGSTAIKAHADVIVCQEQVFAKDGDEIVNLAGFMKDAPDFGPLELEETGYETFTWRVKGNVGEAQEAFKILQAHGGPFETKRKATAVLQAKSSLSEKTAYRRVNDLISKGLLRKKNNQYVVTGGAPE